jgi:hypothetical protein
MNLSSGMGSHLGAVRCCRYEWSSSFLSKSGSLEASACVDKSGFVDTSNRMAKSPRGHTEVFRPNRFMDKVSLNLREKAEYALRLDQSLQLCRVAKHVWSVDRPSALTPDRYVTVRHTCMK